MKKVVLLCLVFLTCCTPVSAPPTVTYEFVQQTQTLQDFPALDAFRSDEQCPNICWLGIHPGITTAEDAIRLFRDAEGKISMRISDNGIDGEWYSDKAKMAHCFVTINFSNG